MKKIILIAFINIFIIFSSSVVYSLAIGSTVDELAELLVWSYDIDQKDVVKRRDRDRLEIEIDKKIRKEITNLVNGKQCDLKYFKSHKKIRNQLLDTLKREFCLVSDFKQKIKIKKIIDAIKKDKEEKFFMEAMAFHIFLEQEDKLEDLKRLFSKVKRKDKKDKFIRTFFEYYNGDLEREPKLLKVRKMKQSYLESVIRGLCSVLSSPVASFEQKNKAVNCINRSLCEYGLAEEVFKTKVKKSISLYLLEYAGLFFNKRGVLKREPFSEDFIELARSCSFIFFSNFTKFLGGTIDYRIVSLLIELSKPFSDDSYSLLDNLEELSLNYIIEDFIGIYEESKRIFNILKKIKSKTEIDFSRKIDDKFIEEHKDVFYFVDLKLYKDESCGYLINDLLKYFTDWIDNKKILEKIEEFLNYCVKKYPEKIDKKAFEEFTGLLALDNIDYFLSKELLKQVAIEKYEGAVEPMLKNKDKKIQKIKEKILESKRRKKLNKQSDDFKIEKEIENDLKEIFARLLECIIDPEFGWLKEEDKKSLVDYIDSVIYLECLRSNDYFKNVLQKLLKPFSSSNKILFVMKGLKDEKFIYDIVEKTLEEEVLLQQDDSKEEAFWEQNSVMLFSALEWVKEETLLRSFLNKIIDYANLFRAEQKKWIIQSVFPNIGNIIEQKRFTERFLDVLEKDFDEDVVYALKYFVYNNINDNDNLLERIDVLWKQEFLIADEA
jgi:hypothetical protein